ncbi:MAG: hypothetical protein PVJ57_11280 [Phycisphaerae bacterium]|jgi:hypothetical protein
MKDALVQLLGREHRLHDVNLALRRYIRDLDAPVVGALHVTCADESEWECIDSFQRSFVAEMLPDLKFARKAPFRLSNLGARYEWGALPVAEHHYATPESRSTFKALLVKLNAHVAVDGFGEQSCYGRMQRYDTHSTACGALHALMAGNDNPSLRDLREAFEEEGIDRLALLADDQRVDPAQRSLFVALINARRQTARVLREIAEHVPASPTFYVVASCVTLNRPAEDTELLCGLALVDHRTGEQTAEYIGLGDDPTRYRVTYEGPTLMVHDDNLPA